jgi:hypothetical protein
MADGMIASPILGMRNAGDHFAGPAARAEGAGALHLWGGDEFSFYDLLDLVNPLQHIPIVSNWYRSATGDEIGAVARIVGGALLGGPIGAVTAVVNSAMESNTGKDLGEHALALLNGEESFGDGEAPLLASMGDRSPDSLARYPEGVLPDRGGDGVQSAGSRGLVEIDGLPWLDGGSPESGPVLTASAGPPAVMREIGADEALPWLRDRADSPPAATLANLSAPPGAHGADQAPAAPGPWIADAMMDALDKYGAIARQQGRQVFDSAV